MASTSICPRCSQPAGIPIEYGMPSYEAFEAEQRGKIVLGGCDIDGEPPDYHCRNCGYEWRSEEVRISVPEPDASWLDIWEFALTYNGYEHHGDRTSRIGNRSLEQWNQTGQVPRTLDSARTALFFEQRRFHHYGTDPDEKHERYIRGLVGRIGKLTGGFVPGPPDAEP